MIQGVVEQSALAEAGVHNGATLGISSRGGGKLAGDDDVAHKFWYPQPRAAAPAQRQASSAASSSQQEAQL